jgi:site-specific recombinase XerC
VLSALGAAERRRAVARRAAHPGRADAIARSAWTNGLGSTCGHGLARGRSSQRQLGHANLGTTSIYVQAIDLEEIITAVRSRSAPMMSASAGLRL